MWAHKEIISRNTIQFTVDKFVICYFVITYSRLADRYRSASLYLSETFRSRSIRRYVGGIFVSLAYQSTSRNDANYGH